MLDLLIRGGTVVDGTGRVPVRADVGVAGGRIAFIDVDRTEESGARRIIDADGLTVAPGFIDVHTHYDAQLFWDPACTPSSLHGVTTVFAGNCGFSISPVGDDPEYLMRLLSRVEGIPLAALEKGVPWTWRSFPDYLDAVESSGVAVNVGVLIGHSALRRAVLGSRSHDAAVAPDALAAMRDMLGAGLGAGGMGFSSSWAGTHWDGDGQPVPSRSATARELIALAGALEDFPGTQLEFIPTNGAFEEAHLEVMTEMSLAGRATLNWNVLIPRSFGWIDNRLHASDYASDRGAHVVGLSYPDIIRARVSFMTSAFDSIPGWGPIMALPATDKLTALVERRVELRAGALTPEGRARRLDAMVVAETYDPANAGYRGRRLGEIAGETGQDPLDLLCDIAVADGLRTGFVPDPQANDDEAWAARVSTWTDPRVIIGASDGGAHLDMLSTFDYAVRFVALQREMQVLSLAEAVRLLTDVPGRLYGLRDRGRLEPDSWADMVLFDADSVGTGPVEWRDDLPAGAGRLYAEPTGIAHVMVNGTEIVAGGRVTGRSPGRVLRAQ